MAVKFGGGDNWNASVLGNVPCLSYRVKVVCRTAEGHIMLGLAPSAGFDPNRCNFDTCGWYIYVRDGTLHCPCDRDKDGNFRGVPVQNGSILEVTFDPSAKTISFSVGHNNLGV